MRKNNRLIQKTLSLGLALCMTMTLCTAEAYGNPGAQQTEEQAVPVTGEDAADPAYSSADSDLNSAGNAAVNPPESGSEEVPSDDLQDPAEADPETNGDGSTNTEGTISGSEKNGTEEETLESEEETEEKESEEAGEAEFQETGLFSIRITDRNGSEVLPWHDEKADIYYLFLTNAASISELELKVEGVKIEKSSKGTLDKKTNIVTGAFTSSGDGITLTDKRGTKYNVIVKQSGLPSLSITLNTTDLDTIHAGSKSVKYPGQSVVLTDASGNVNLSQTDVEIKGRGNTTWVYTDKKPYQIKFSKKQSVLGMGKAKKWVLLANYYDDSMLRNRTAYYLGDALGMSYSPDLEFVDLWIDGEYRGVFTIGEKSEIDASRLNLTDPQGSLMEWDNWFYSQEDYWFYDSELKTHFGMAESVDDGQAQAALDSFQSKTTAFGKYLYSTDPSEVTLKDLEKYIDIESFTKWYLINEYLANAESYGTSWFWYSDGPSDVLHLGPLWDFDTSQGVVASYSKADSMYGKDHSSLWNRLLQAPAFAEYVKQMYAQYRGEFSSLSALVSSWGSQLSAAADCNYTRWQILGTDNFKGDMYADTYQDAVNNLSRWLADRDRGFGVDVPSAVTARTSVSVSENGKTMTLKADHVTGSSSVTAAVWSADKGQDDLKWYTLKKSSDGTWKAAADLTRHGSSDTYYAHFYSGKTLLGAHETAVVMNTAKPEVQAEYQEKSGNIRITVKNIEDYSSLQTAVWTHTNSQDDLKWLTLKVNGKNELTMELNAADLKHNGLAYVHVYGKKDGKQKFLTSTTLTLTDPGKPQITAVQTDGGSVLDITAENMAGWSNVIAAVWGRANDQNDLKWYSLTKNSDGNWTQAVDLSAHKETGVFYVHIYGNKGGKRILAGAAELNVKAFAKPVVAVTALQEGETLQAVLKNAPSLSSASFAVWGEKDGQNDIRWYNAAKSPDGTWRAEIPLEKHQETGNYFIHAYGKKGKKQTFQAAATHQVEQLNCRYLDCRVSTSGKTLNAVLENGNSLSDVTFAVWGQENGQNDLKWYKGKKNLDGSWTASVSLAAHKETGKYFIHAYEMKKGSNTFLSNTTVNVGSFAKPAVHAEEKGVGFQVSADNTDDYSKVRFAVWTEYKGQDDLKWYKGLRYPDNSFRSSVLYGTHGGNGTYIVHVYGTRNGKESIIGSTSFVKNNLEKPEVQAELNKKGTKITVTVKDPVGYPSIQAAIWGEKDGQNDLKWYEMTKTGADTWEIKADVSSHNEKGLYYIHVYGTAAGTKYFMGSSSLTVV